MRKSPDITIEMLAKNEEFVGQLYQAYANRFQEMKDFWLDLADDERTHAVWIRILKDMVLEEKLSFNMDRLGAASVSAFSSQIKNEIARTTAKGIILNDAFSVAISIEENLVESKYFDGLETDSMDIKKILKDLDTATQEHAQKLREEWDIHRQNNP